MAESDILKLGARPLRLSELRRVYDCPVTVAIAPEALEGVRAAHVLTARLAAAGIFVIERGSISGPSA